MSMIYSISKEAENIIKTVNLALRLKGKRDGYSYIMSLLYENHLNDGKKCFVSNSTLFNSDEVKDLISQDDLAVLLNEYKAVIEYCWNGILTDSVYGMEHFHVNDSVSSLCLSISPLKQNSGVCLLYAASCDAITLLKNSSTSDVTMVEAEYDRQSYECDKIVSSVFFDNNIQFLHTSDVYKNSDKYDYVVACPPFSSNVIELNRIKYLFDEIVFSRLKDNADFFAILPGSFNWGAMGWNFFREKLAASDENYSVEIISLPSIFKEFVKFKTCFLHIKNDHKGGVSLLDATGSCYKDKVYNKGNKLIVSKIVEDLKNEQCECLWHGSITDIKLDNWDPSYRLFDKYSLDVKDGYSIYPIGDIVEFKHEDFIQNSTQKRCPVINPSDLRDNFLDAGLNQDSLPFLDFSNLKQTKKASDYEIARSGDIVLYHANGVCKFAKLLGDSECLISKRKNMFVVSANQEKIVPEFFFYVLKLDEFGIQSNMLSTGTHNMSLSERDFKRVKIQIPSLEEQDRLFKEATREKLTEADKLLLENAETFRRETHVKKHAIGQTVASIGAWAHLLEMACNAGVIDGQAEFGNRKKTKVADMISSLMNSVGKIETQLAKFDAGYGMKPEWIVLADFLDEYVRTHRQPLFEFVYNRDYYCYDYDINEDGKTVECGKHEPYEKVYFPKEALESILNNIVSNACSHGFEEGGNNKIKFYMELEPEDGSFSLIVFNNGKPIDEEVLPHVFDYSISTGKESDGHYGIGGYEVKKLMNEFDGEVSVCNEDGLDLGDAEGEYEEYHVFYILNFKKANIDASKIEY